MIGAWSRHGRTAVRRYFQLNNPPSPNPRVQLLPAILSVIAIVVSAIGLRVHSRWLGRRLLARLRGQWGRPVAARTLDDDRVAESWLEAGAAGRNSQAIDDRTWADLDLDSVCATIDRTHTALGRQTLYRRMRSGESWNDSLSLEALTAQCGREPQLREAIGAHLAGAGKSLGFGLWVITRPDLILVRWWYAIFPVLALAMMASVVILPFEPRALVAVVAIAVINMLVRMATAWQIPGLLAPMRQIGPLIAAADRVSKTLHEGGAGSARISESIARLRPLRRISRWVSRDAGAAGEILSSIWEYLNILFILDANALLFSARYLRQLGPLLGEVAGWLGDVDVALAVASLRAEPRPWCIPVDSRRDTTCVRGIWHPLIQSPVANDVEISPGSGLIITGANMSGKSTYLRAVGIAVVLSRAINTCPATAWEGPCYRVRSLIGRADDLSAGKSYYQVEADGVVALLHESRESVATIFLLDELLRGTNTIERLAAGEAVLRALLGDHGGNSPHAVIVATHDGELVSMLADRYVPFHFRETIGPGGLSFGYQRHEGAASTRTAIALLEATGAPREVVEAARRRAGELDVRSKS